MWKPRFSQNNKDKNQENIEIFSWNIIKYAIFSDVKQNASQNSADFGGQDLILRKYEKHLTQWKIIRKQLKTEENHLEKVWNPIKNKEIQQF